MTQTTPKPMFDPVPAQTGYRDVEARVLAFWREHEIFKKSESKPAPHGDFVFYEGPPTANGQPAMHHVLARAFKDIFPRYRTMRGFHVTRKGGWDTHGLPVEIAVEKKLGLSGRNHGASRAELEEFNRLCRESVFANIKDWDYFTERLGMWVDLENAYVTYHNTYIESVWNLLKRLWDKGLIEQDYKVVPVSPRIGSTLSANEIADGYRDVPDPSVYVRFPVKLETTPKALRAELEAQGVNLENLEQPALVVWTTTPWTLPSNTMAAVHPDLEYVLARSEMGHVIVASGAVERMSELHKDQPPLEVVARFPGRLMEWWQYDQPFPEVFAELDLNGEKWGRGPSKPRAHFVALADFVSDTDGSGIAHEAPVYGAEDLELSRQYDAVLCFGTNVNGIMQVTSEKGKFFKDADKGLIRVMKERGVMFHAGQIVHSYPFHDRTGDPILYFAKRSWFVRTSQKRAELAAANQRIRWVPPHIRDGRFGNWLENNVDWSISRERYWGTPLPFWVSEDGTEKVCVGSVKELEHLSGRTLKTLDLHRPFVDDVSFEKNAKTYRRVPEVLDVWFDSGAMPYAQWHVLLEADGTTPLEGSEANLETFNHHFPADYICEAIDQTRGWFYSLHAISTLLYDQPCFKNVICLGHLVDEKGKKMSKSLGNVVEPLPAFDKYGADSVRWYMFTATEPGDVKRFSERLVLEAQRGFVNTLWNTYSFFVLYANLDQPDLSNPPRLEDRPEIDRWLIARLEQTKKLVTDGLENYDARGAGRALEAFVDEVSNWYVRRNRNRFWGKGGNVDQAAYATLYHALVTVSKLAAPFTPFLAEALYQNLVLNVDPSQAESVHLADWPAFDASRFDEKLVQDMDAVLRVVDLGRAARGQSNLKTRQPLVEVRVRARTPEANAALERFKGLLEDELNVKKVSFLEDGANLVSYSLKPNLPTLGRKHGKAIPAIKKALESLNAAEIVNSVRDGQNFLLETEAGTLELAPEDVLVDAKSPDGLAAVEQDGFLVAFDTKLTRELVLEGLARDLVRAVQQARKDVGFEVSDRIELRANLEGDALEAARMFESYLTGETLTVKLEFASPLPDDVVVDLEDGGSIGLKRV
jgi:isoleucyl-tRNA synthetase